MLCATLASRGRHWRRTWTRLEFKACRSTRPDYETDCPRASVLHSVLLLTLNPRHRTSVSFHKVTVFFLKRDKVVTRSLQTCVSCPPSRHGSSLPFKASEGACCWRCLWGCPVPTCSRPPCCPPPRLSCGPKSEGLAAGPSSQSRSSTLWPSQKRRARTARSCPPPAADGINLQLGNQTCSEKPKNRVSPRVFWRTVTAPGPSEFPQAAAGRASKKDIKSFWRAHRNINTIRHKHRVQFPFPVSKKTTWNSPESECCHLRNLPKPASPVPSAWSF